MIIFNSDIMKEIETKIIGFDEKEIIKILDKDTVKVFDRIQKRWIFDLSENDEETDEFIRVRTDGSITTLTYKYRKGEGLSNTEELEVGTTDFNTTASILKKIFKNYYYQENRRVEYDYKGVEITLNYWPLLDPVIEIEAKSEEMINKTITELKIKGVSKGNVGWKKIYEEKGIDLHSFKELKFESTK